MVVARRGRHCRCMGCAAIASHNASISRARDPSGTPVAQRPVRSSAALIRHGRHSRIYEYSRCFHERKREGEEERERERKKKNSNSGDRDRAYPRACPRACVRARFVLSVTMPVLREGSSNQCTHTYSESCDIVCVHRELVWKRTQRILLRCFGIIEGNSRQANKREPRGQQLGLGFFFFCIAADSWKNANFRNFTFAHNQIYYFCRMRLAILRLLLVESFY